MQTSNITKSSKRILARHQSQDVMPEGGVTHDLKQKEKLDKSAQKIAEYLATKKRN